MTRDEHRAQCIEAMCTAMNKLYDDPMCSQPKDSDWMDEATAAFDSLRSAGARVLPIEATEEMIETGQRFLPYEGISNGLLRNILIAMAADGDLTNPPETKP